MNIFAMVAIFAIYALPAGTQRPATCDLAMFAIFTIVALSVIFCRKTPVPQITRKNP